MDVPFDSRSERTVCDDGCQHGEEAESEAGTTCGGHAIAGSHGQEQRAYCVDTEDLAQKTLACPAGVAQLRIGAQRRDGEQQQNCAARGFEVKIGGELFSVALGDP